MLINYLRRNLSVQIFFITLLVLVLACSITYGFIAWFMPVTYMSNLDTQLDNQMQQIVRQLKQTEFSESGPVWEYIVMELNAQICLKTDDGQGIALPGSAETAIVDAAVDEETVVVTDYAISVAQSGEEFAAQDGEVVIQQATEVMDMDDTAAFSVTVEEAAESVMATKEYDIQFSGDSAHYTLYVTGSLQAVNQAVDALHNILPWLTVVILVISAGSAWFCSCFIARPVEQLSVSAQQLSQLNFNWRCSEKRKDELGVLAHSLNTLAQRLQTTLQELRSANQKLQADSEQERELEHKRLAFFSAVSHELKTPITIVKGQLEGMQAGIGVYQDRDKYLARSLQVMQKMEQLVQEILIVTRMESDSFILQRKSVLLTELILQLTEDYGEFAQQRQQRLEVQLEPNILYSGDEGLLKKAFSNLLSNAVRHSPMHSVITVSLRQIENDVQLQIENTGIKIPDDDLPRLFEAFYRVDSSRNSNTGGSGLGLYLVKMIAELHGGSCWIENYDAGVRTVLVLKNNVEAKETVIELPQKEVGCVI